LFEELIQQDLRHMCLVVGVVGAIKVLKVDASAPEMGWRLMVLAMEISDDFPEGSSQRTSK
jgi:hypothetical protein